VRELINSAEHSFREATIAALLSSIERELFCQATGSNDRD